ncbi:hypothetical protein [Ensifer aridi]|uniref:hypothetical protein n=1 Tax=Ensifer aridi TaxID=1708715 RepID=UPI00358F4B63
MTPSKAEARPQALCEHYCEHPGCNKWGGFGFAVGKSEPTWFCFGHRPEWKPRNA